MKKKLKRYELKIDVQSDAIVSAIALVEDPAIESNFLAFNESLRVEQFASNDERQELLGAAMIPNQVIYRRNEKTGEEFEVFFSVDTIREIAKQYFKYGFQNSMNLNHTSVPAGSYIFQSYIVDSSKGIPAPNGIEVPDGSWVVGVKVDDSKAWNDVKSGKVKGFSIEGVFEFIDEKFQNENNDEAELMEILSQINQLIKNKK